MSLPVHWVPSLAGVATGSDVVVEGDEAHHAVAVRRLQVAERVLLTDGRGTAAVTRVAITGKRVFTATVESLSTEPEPEPRVVVVQALPKGDRGELAVQLLTEVGASRIVPWAATHSIATWKGERAARSLARWRVTAHEAAKQARRSWFPQVDALATTSDVVELVGDASLAVVLHEAASEPLASLDVPATGPLVLVVGPEGGLTELEVDAFVAAGATAARLGAEVLRTSTAGAVAAAALLARTPRWSGAGD